MKLRNAVSICGGLIACLGSLYAFQKPFHEYPGIEYGQYTLPPDYQEKTEWAFARLMYPPGWNNGYEGRDGPWKQGFSLWTQDYPAADRHFAEAVRRLTRVHVRSVEQAVDLEDENEVYNWPWLYAVQVGEWGITPAQAKVLREYLLRGGFFLADDFHGTVEWGVFQKAMKLVFPDRIIEDIPDGDAIFHTVYDLKDRYQIPGREHLREGSKNGSSGGIGAHWQAIRDDKGRIMVAITYNSDVGDSWEWADRPEYPEKFSALGIRVGVNYIVYAMTH